METACTVRVKLFEVNIASKTKVIHLIDWFDPHKKIILIYIQVITMMNIYFSFDLKSRNLTTDDFTAT